MKLRRLDNKTGFKPQCRSLVHRHGLKTLRLSFNQLQHMHFMPLCLRHRRRSRCLDQLHNWARANNSWHTTMDPVLIQHAMIKDALGHLASLPA